MPDRAPIPVAVRALGRLAFLVVLLSGPLAAQQPTFRDSLLDRYVGHWVARGTIAGRATVHDVTNEWVLAHQFLRVHEVARERDSAGRPAYEATVYIGWDAKAREYTCVWLDVFGNVAAQSIAHAPAGSDSLAFLFHYDDGSRMHTTMAWRRDRQGWDWILDGEPAGQPETRTPFARLTLTRALTPRG